MASQPDRPSNYYFPRTDLDFFEIEVFASPINGSGVRAKRAFGKGEEILPLTGVLRYTLQHEDAGDHMLMQIDDSLWLKGVGNPDDYINHSCAPNMGFSSTGDSYVALCDIRKGEELFFDYEMADFDTPLGISCSCGAPACRKIIKGFKYLPANKQKSLLPHTLPYIRRHYE